MRKAPELEPVSDRNTAFHRVFIMNGDARTQSLRYAAGNGGFCGVARSIHFVPIAMTVFPK